ncbi:MAG: Rubrerythrin [Dehalococcoidia bacterium]|nr:Rubrerythrin [Dehalococcoidia bacterium]MBF8303860.1 Rubrerythrin [Dehalococcoidia bacterium]
MAADIALEALKQALNLEKEGILFYKEAAEKVKDAAGGKIFLSLAEDERDHQRILSAQIRSLESGKGWSRFPETEGMEPIKGAPSLFPMGKADVQKAAATVSTELDAIRFGLDIENRSYEFYFKASRETKVAEAMAMYSFLAGMERDHFNTLMMRYEGLGGPAGWTY